MSPYEKSQNPLGIRVGDTVEIDFHFHDDPAFLADVVELSDRAGMGYDACIEYKRHDGIWKNQNLDMPDGCSVSYVTRIVARKPYVALRRAPQNNFADSLAEDAKRRKELGYGWSGYYNVGCLRVGMLNHMVVAALACAHDELSRPLDPDKFNALWAKAHFPGRTASPDEELYPTEHYTCVRWKAFKRFVLANRHRILCTRAEVLKNGRACNEAMWAADYECLEEESTDFEVEAA